jgi:hypothetical protein
MTEEQRTTEAHRLAKRAIWISDADLYNAFREETQRLIDTAPERGATMVPMIRGGMISGEPEDIDERCHAWLDMHEVPTFL